ncbi:MAG TPA: hypothetical protein VIT41_03240 [Microlunatus sp.]
MTLTGRARLARAGVFGGASLFLATAGHVVGGGVLPGAGLLALTAVGLALVAVTLTARRLRFGVLLAALGVEQVLLHLLFHASTTAATCAAVVMPGHGMSAASVCGTGAPAVADWPMLVGHALAVLATAWLMARGERRLWALADRIHRCAWTAAGRVRRPRPTVVAVLVTFLAPTRWVLTGPRAPPLA